jgi:hypothetical protein
VNDDLADGLTEPARDGADTEQSRAALAEASAWVDGEVSAVGLGHTDDGDRCVVVYAGEHAPELPAEVAGLPVRIVRSGPFQALDELERDHPA